MSYRRPAMSRVILLSAGCLLIAGLGAACTGATLHPTPTPTVQPKATPSATQTLAPSPTPSATPTEAATPTQAVTASPTPVPPTSTPTSSAGATINIVAHNIAFDLKTITIPAGTTITVHMTNDDSVPHNFAVYTKKGGTELFAGPIFQGPNVTKTFTFTSPSTPGTYYFQCDVHPTLMFGTLNVT